MKDFIGVIIFFIIGFFILSSFIGGEQEGILNEMDSCKEIIKLEDDIYNRVFTKFTCTYDKANNGKIVGGICGKLDINDNGICLSLKVYEKESEVICSKNSTLNKWEGTCDCDEGTTIKNGVCELTFEQKIKNAIGGTNIILRDIELVEGELNTYIGLYIKNAVYNNEKVDTEFPFMSCPEEATGQTISGEYHVFTYVGGKITSDLIIPKAFESKYFSSNQFTFKNTKNNNNRFFGGKKPIDSEKDELEQTKLINLVDYNGDGIKNEFRLINSWESSCGIKGYIIIGYNLDTKESYIYPINASGEIAYWRHNFLPDDNGKVFSGYNCGNHGYDTFLYLYYNYNTELKRYDLVDRIEGNCSDKYWDKGDTHYENNILIREAYFGYLEKMKGSIINNDYEGTYISSNGLLLIHKSDNHDYYYRFNVNKGPPSYNNGTHEGKILINENNVISESKNCNIVFNFLKNSLFVKNPNSNNECGFGYGVTLEGGYIKRSNLNPIQYQTIIGENKLFKDLYNLN